MRLEQVRRPRLGQVELVHLPPSRVSHHARIPCRRGRLTKKATSAASILTFFFAAASASAFGFAASTVRSATALVREAAPVSAVEVASDEGWAPFVVLEARDSWAAAEAAAGVLAVFGGAGVGCGSDAMAVFMVGAWYG